MNITKNPIRTAIILMLFLFLLIFGCSQQTPSTYSKLNQQTNQVNEMSDVERTLVREIADGRLVEVYDEFVEVKPGKTTTNWMIIRNVRNTPEIFSIIPCKKCIFQQTQVRLQPGKYDIIEFEVGDEPGQTEIRVKDRKSNAYGFAKISVIVE